MTSTPSTYSQGAEPSFTAMWHAHLRNMHATQHDRPILDDRQSVQLVPESVGAQVAEVMGRFSPHTADAIIAMSVVRHRLLLDQIHQADQAGVRQLVVLGAGLDTTAYRMPGDLSSWTVFEVDHPATQTWKQGRAAAAGWQTPSNLVYAPCDFESQEIFHALSAVGFDVTQPALVSLFGVILYLTREATIGAFEQLADLAPGSSVVVTYSPPPDGGDPIAAEAFGNSSKKVDSTGESFIGHYSAEDLEALIRHAGFGDVTHHPNDELSRHYFGDRSDGLRLAAIEQILTARPA